MSFDIKADKESTLINMGLDLGLDLNGLDSYEVKWMALLDDIPIQVQFPSKATASQIGGVVLTFFKEQHHFLLNGEFLPREIEDIYRSGTSAGDLHLQFTDVDKYFAKRSVVLMRQFINFRQFLLARDWLRVWERMASSIGEDSPLSWDELKKLEVYLDKANEFRDWLLSKEKDLFTSLDLSNLQLTSLPEELASLPLKELNLLGNRLRTFSLNIPSLEALNLSKNPVLTFPEDLHELCPELETLIFNKGKLEKWPPVQGLEKLKNLQLNYNHLTEIPVVVKQNKKLRTLGLRGNAIRGISGEIGELKLLEQIDLADNEPRKVARDFQWYWDTYFCLDMPKQVHDLFHNGVLDNVPREIKALLNEEKWTEALLKAGTYVRNKLADQLPQELCVLVDKSSILHMPYPMLTRVKDEKVEEVYEAIEESLIPFRLRALPDGLGNCCSLTELNLSGNDLETLPESFSTLPFLKTLDLSGNHFSLLPSFFKEIDTLETLDLKGNRFTQFPVVLSEMKSLKSWSLANNQVQQVTSSLIEVQNWDEYALSWNCLTTIPQKILEFAEVREITNLVLVSNKIRIIPKEVGDLSSLKILDLTFNQIEEIPDELGKLTNLKQLRLARNKIKNVPEAVGNLTNLEELVLSSNQKLQPLPLSVMQLPNLKIEVANTPLEKKPSVFKRHQISWLVSGSVVLLSAGYSMMSSDR
ncbi:MAG: E3 ubiquitin-protein ligase SlrP [Chlamydiae bacterium]|nr:E3 ubiquitin-protein ligase SlrP [Chlamydiota bacterium]